MRGTAMVRIVGSSPKSNVRPIDFRGTMDLRDFTRIIGEENGFLRSAGALLHLVKPSRSVHILWVNAASKADSLASGGSIEGLLQSFPRFSQGARLLVRPGGGNIVRTRHDGRIVLSFAGIAPCGLLLPVLLYICSGMDERGPSKGVRCETFIPFIHLPREDGSQAGSSISLAFRRHASGNQDQDAYKELRVGNDTSIQGSLHLFSSKRL